MGKPSQVRKSNMRLAFLPPLPSITRPTIGGLVSKCTSTVVRKFATMSSAHPIARGLPPIELNPNLDVHIVPILADNFSYLLHDKKSNVATFVDPAEPRPLLELADELGASVTTSLTTHHHWDHAGGNEELAATIPGIDIIGSAYETAAAITKRLYTGDVYKIRQSSLSVKAMHTPCHTSGHLCFSVDAGERKAVFTGDTLFVAGCGRFFEGNAQDMHKSLNVVLSSLDDDTLVFCGHEYTVSNLKFAVSVEPSNEDIQRKLDWAVSRVQNRLPTIPTTIGDERRTNPYMRNSIPDVKLAVGMPSASEVDVLKELRERKNSFRAK